MNLRAIDLEGRQPSMPFMLFRGGCIFVLTTLHFSNSPARATISEPPRFIAEGDSHYVLWQGQPVLELYQGRTLRFRATTENDHWVGVKPTPDITVTPDVTMDDARIGLTWGNRNDPDYKAQAINFTLLDDGFLITVDARKSQPEAKLTATIKARLLSPAEGYEYEIDTTFESKLSELRKARKFGKGPKTIEPFDYHLERVSMPDRLRGDQKGRSDLYNGFVRSQDGENWLFIPKLHVPTHMMPDGHYEPSNYRGNNGRGVLPPTVEGSWFGALDSREGGWLTQILKTSKPLKIALCWMFFDVHHYMVGGVPESAPDDLFKREFAIRFTPVTPEKSRQLIAKAKEVKWKGTPEYALPVFSWHNTFSELVSPGKQCWFKSGPGCFRDDTVGMDDQYSISIKKNDADKASSAWYGWCWGPAYEIDTPLDGTYRFTAWIKTADCKGKVRFGINESNSDNWYARDKPGKWSNQNHIITWAEKEMSGTNEWTRVSVDLKIDDTKIAAVMARPVSHMWIRRAPFIEQSGPGQCWIDNVTIQRLEHAQ